ncbi:TadE/TadG family type IV pilus assembly protein [Angustibacter aerolatus]
MTRRRTSSDGGSMSVELVLMTPVLVLFLLVVVACGRYVNVRGELQATSRDAVRAASIARSQGEAVAAAQAAVRDAAPTRTRCSQPTVNGSWAPVAPDELRTVSVTLTCKVSYGDLGIPGLGGSHDLRATSTAPLDVYRRTTG